MQYQRTSGLVLSLALSLVFSSVPALSASPVMPPAHGVSKPAPTHPPSKNSPSENAEAQNHASSTADNSSKSDESGKLVNGKITLGKDVHKNGFHKGEPVVVVVDKSAHYTYVMALQKDGKVVEVLRASNAIGTQDTPTPPGPYKVWKKLKWPSWIPPKSIDPKQKAIQPYNKDHNNPLGVAYIGLNKFGIYMHGTNDPKSLRHSVSHGCIRHSNKDIMKIFNMVNLDTTVVITKHFAGTTLSKKEFETEHDTWLNQGKSKHHEAARVHKHADKSRPKGKHGK